MLSAIIKVIIIVVICLGLLYAGTCVYTNFIAEPDDGIPDAPNIEKATHSFVIANTGNMVLSSDFEIFGEEFGKRTIVLHSYWEVRGKEFKFVDTQVVLDEKRFGDIIIKRR